MFVPALYVRSVRAPIAAVTAASSAPVSVPTIAVMSAVDKVTETVSPAESNSAPVRLIV